MSYGICRKVNMFTTVRGVTIPVFETIGVASSLPAAADALAKRYDHPDLEFPEDTYFIVEREITNPPS